ncbi:hypothetical protein SCHPADRAFT_907130 [Schizopora paradoxa]|uniref:Uncharacterized protein n=1 Tax=Schizopora paradoxa TaxID=27342 RepID=A0A0H2RE97_9AGAM|nr:hypothetical protein SCHPADRAFT_907130 [Schizopora paradoxa]
MRVYDSLIFGSFRYSRLQKAPFFKAILELSALVVIGLSAASVNLAKEDDIDIFNAFDFGSKGNARQVALLALYVSCFTELLLVLFPSPASSTSH